MTAPVAFGSMHVAPQREEALPAHAHLRVKLLLLDRVVNLVEEGVDVAVRIGHPPDSALLATQVGPVRRVVVASPTYIAQHGEPTEPQDLASHRCIASTSLTPHEARTFAGRAGRRATSVRVQPTLSANTVDGALRAAERGVGITSSSTP